jgi:hypothetical protein
MFEFIRHPKYGCHDLKGLNTRVIKVIVENLPRSASDSEVEPRLTAIATFLPCAA